MAVLHVCYRGTNRPLCQCNRMKQQQFLAVDWEKRQEGTCKRCQKVVAKIERKQNEVKMPTVQ